MATYSYVARNASGELQSGTLVALTDAGVADILQQQGLIPLEIQPFVEHKTVRDLLKSEITPRRIKVAELSLFCRQMYAMLKAGVPIISSLRRLLETTREKTLRNIIQAVIAEISAGHSLSEALQQHPRVFKPIMISIVDAGEQSGQMEMAFLQLADYFELENRTVKSIKAALRYPVMVLVAVLAGIMVLNFMVIPAFGKIFSGFHTQLPLPTRIIFAVSTFFLNHWLALLLFIVLLVIVLKVYLQSKEGALLRDRLALRLPVLGSLLERIIMARFARVFSMLLSSGVPLVNAVELLSRAVGNLYVGSLLIGMKGSVEKGESLLQAATKTGLFPKMVLQMIAIGEEAGVVDEMMAEVANFYEREVAYDMTKLADLIQPILTVLMGAMVLVLALGVFLPMWNMISFAQAK